MKCSTSRDRSALSKSLPFLPFVFLMCVAHARAPADVPAAGACGPTPWVSAESFELDIAKAQTRLAGKVKASAGAQGSAQATYLEFSAALLTGRKEAAAEAIRKLANTARDSADPDIFGIAFTACHLKGPGLAPGACKDITADTWKSYGKDRQAATAGAAVLARSEGDDRTLARAFQDLSEEQKEYDAFVPLKSIVDGASFNSLSKTDQLLVALAIWNDINLFALKPTLINYCGKNELSDTERKRACGVLAVGLLRSSPHLADRIESLHIIRATTALSREQVARTGARVLPLRKLLKKDLVLDRDWSCEAIATRGRLAIDIVRYGEIPGYERYFAAAAR